MKEILMVWDLWASFPWQSCASFLVDRLFQSDAIKLGSNPAVKSLSDYL